MRQLRYGLGTALVCMTAACGSSTSATGGTGGAKTASSSSHGGSTGNGGSGGSGGGLVTCPADAGPAKGIEHVVIIVQENHTFDSYFGRWCTAPTGSNPTCTNGPSCCEAAPDKDPTGASPIVLDDAANAGYDPSHLQACEIAEIDDGKMDGFVKGPSCANAGNFAYATTAAAPYHALAEAGAVADRYFQPIAGQSTSNDMYLAVAKEVFIDDEYEANFPGSQCGLANVMSFTGTTIADLLKTAGKSVAWYGEGYDKMKAAGTNCPTAPADCSLHLSIYPCVFDPADIPFVYYPQWQTDATFVRDYTQLATDVAQSSLPDVSYVKGIGYHSEHPGYGDTISAGTTFVKQVIDTIQNDCAYRANTLILITWDEGGGFFDHVAPPATSTVDNQPYGTRIPLIAVGPFAKKGTVSHVQMEHSSIVKFLEWNFLGGQTGQLMARDATVNNIGSLLDPAATGVTVPSN